MARSPLRVLFIPREDPNWQWARGNTYSANFAWEEGLSANGVEYITVPVLSGVPCASPAWASTIREICVGRRFDQVWIEMIYSPFDEATLSWLAELAPVRMGFVWESLEYTPAVGELHASARSRSIVESRLPYVTHLLMFDEKDAEEIQQSGRVAAMWGPASVPGRYISDGAPPPAENCALFAGSLYEKRQDWLARASLKAPLARLTPPEDATAYPALFDELNQAVALQLLLGLPISETLLSAYLEEIRVVRREIYGMWVAGLRHGCAVLNLPHYVKSYPGRVTEGMAAGRPVISCDIPDRPRNRALFEDGKEILLFPEDDPSMCDAHIERIVNDPGFAAEVAANARRKLRSFHTTEKRAGQILHWIETGDQPTYGGA